MECFSGSWPADIRMYNVLHTQYVHTNIRTYKHTNIQAYRNTSIQAYKHTNIQTYKHTNTQTHKYTNIQKYKNTKIQEYKHTRIQEYKNTNKQTTDQSINQSIIHTCMHACIHTYIHTSIHPSMHACMHTYIQTYVYTLTHWNYNNIFELLDPWRDGNGADRAMWQRLNPDQFWPTQTGVAMALAGRGGATGRLLSPLFLSAQPFSGGLSTRKHWEKLGAAGRMWGEEVKIQVIWIAKMANATCNARVSMLQVSGQPLSLGGAKLYHSLCWCQAKSETHPMQSFHLRMVDMLRKACDLRGGRCFSVWHQKLCKKS